MEALRDLLGESAVIEALKQRVVRVLRRTGDARRLPPVLIQGETGAGKGLLARILHRMGPRSDGPFVDVNCAAIPETMLEAEMFGFERGAFTDAHRAKPGLFQAAHRGTLFLDEVALLPEALQSKLLKVMEERSVRRLGSTRSEPVDVWIITATNEDPQLAIRERRFREDLYHRLAVLTFTLPPLRERADDVVRLAEHFLTHACVDYGVTPKVLSDGARRRLLAYGWPGNVRELSNVIERVTLLTDGEVVTAEMLALPMNAPTRDADTAEAPAPAVPTRATSLDDTVRDRLLEVLTETGWNISQTATRLGITRNTVRSRIERYGLRPGEDPQRREPVPRRHEVALPAAVPPPPARLTAMAPLRWERRRIALLRAVVTPLSESEGRLEVGGVLDMLIDKVTTFGGRVEALSPNGLVAAFGIEAAENAASGAAHAALSMQRGVERARNAGGHLSLGVGIHVAQILVARTNSLVQLEAEGTREALTVIERLRADAAGNAIVVSAAAATFLERRFTFAAAPEPGGTARSVVGRLSARTGSYGQTARFVGRQRELELLQSRLESAARGQGQFVGIAGDAGIGKSRLVQELRQNLTEPSVTTLEGHCLSYATAMPYYPVLDLIRASCDIGETDKPEEATTKVAAAAVDAGMDTSEVLPYLLRVLGIKDAASAEDSTSDPDVLRTQGFDVLRQLLMRQSRQRPLLVVVEDLHWVDAASEQFLTSFINAIAVAHVLIVATYRVGYRPPWIERSYVTQIPLQRLSVEHAASIVRAVLEPSTAERVVDLIVEKAEGNPFFLEQLARAVREQGEAAATASAPDTIQEVLLGRIDRLAADERRLLLCAAVVGKDIPLSVLRATIEWPEAQLRAMLRGLQGAEFLVESGAGSEAGYTFRHVLTHEVAYQSLPVTERRALHRRILEALEELHRDRITEYLEHLAHHALAAEAWDQALRYARQAGAKALSRSAHREAVGYFRNALDVLAQQPASDERAALAIDLRFDLRSALLPLGELEQILAYLQEAEVLATALGDRQRIGQLAVYMTGHFYLMGEHARALEVGQRAVAIADALEDFSLRVATNAYVGQIYYVLGDYGRAADFFRRNVDGLVGDAVTQRFGLPQLPSVHSRTCLVWALAERGDFVEGARVGEEAVAIAESMEHPLNVVVACSGLGVLRWRQGEWATAIAVLERAMRRIRESNVALWLPRVCSTLGSAYAATGRLDEAFALLREAIDRAAGMNLVSGRSMLVTALADACLLDGRFAEAGDLGARALDSARTHSERGHEAWALRLLGEVALRRHPLDAEGAAMFLREALALSEELQMRPLMAQTRLSLGELQTQLGQRRLAAEQLTTAIALFREMDMTWWATRAEHERTALG
jgi:DNA-binding NtrC family response regulator/tetratricopeptide (TPR) repeat protein